MKNIEEAKKERVLLLKCPCGFIAFDIVKHKHCELHKKPMEWKQIYLYFEDALTHLSKKHEEEIKSVRSNRDTKHRAVRRANTKIRELLEEIKKLKGEAK